MKLVIKTALLTFILAYALPATFILYSIIGRLEILATELKCGISECRLFTFVPICVIAAIKSKFVVVSNTKITNISDNNFLFFFFS